MTDYDADILWDGDLWWDGEDDILSQENPFVFGFPRQMVAAKPRPTDLFTYRHHEGHLRLTFRTGKTYSYRVSEEIYRAFLEADSKGKFFHEHIRHLGGRQV